MVKQTGQHGYLFMFDKVSATAQSIIQSPDVYITWFQSYLCRRPIDNIAKEQYHQVHSKLGNIEKTHNIY